MKQLDYRTEDRESRAGQVVWGVLLLALLLFGGHTIAAAEVVGGEPGGDSEVMVDMATACIGVLSQAPDIDLWDATSAHDLR